MVIMQFQENCGWRGICIATRTELLLCKTVVMDITFTHININVRRFLRKVTLCFRVVEFCKINPNFNIFLAYKTK